MQDSIVNFATYVKQITSPTGEIKQEEVAPLVEKSNSLLEEFRSLLAEEQAELNKELDQTVRVVLQGLDEENWTIYLNPDLSNQLEGNSLQVFLSSGQQGIEVDADDLNQLLSQHDGLFINVQKTGTDQYAISFADGEGNDIEKLDSPVKIFLPTTNDFATVMLDYAQGSENWGGQFNASTNTIQFSTIHPGTYLVIDNSVEIHDVDETVLSMIQFMVSKGFFSLDESGNFNPWGTMTRNEYTKTIVSMFFALDRQLTSRFSDVILDSEFHDYIASGEAKGIVSGYDDGTFKGDWILTEEMALAQIAQTLVDQKGYIYPTDLDSYLNSRLSADSYSDWAKQALAMSYRDGILLEGNSVTPLGEISRQDAAIYLYRLFMLLEEKQQINFALAEEINLIQEESGSDSEKNDETPTETNPLLYIGVATVGAVALGAGVMLGRRKV